MKYILYTVLLILSAIVTCGGQTQYNGKEFHLALNSYVVGATNAPIAHKGTIVLTSRHHASVQFFYNNTGATATYSVVPGVPTQVFLNQAQIASITGMPLEQVSNRSLRITSDSSITVQFGNKESKVEDAITVLPSDFQDNATEYYTIGMRALLALTLGNYGYVIVANCDNVELEITPVAQTFTHAANVPFTVSLQKGEVYPLATPWTSVPNKDLTGTHIKVLNASCCFPINVFTHHTGVYSKFPWNQTLGLYCCADPLLEQMLPVDWWAREYPVVPFYTHEASIIRVVSSANNNVIRLDGLPVATRNRGEVFDTLIYQATVISADSPVGIANLMLSESFDAPINGDPDMQWCFPMARGVRQAYVPLIRPFFTVEDPTNPLTVIATAANAPTVMLNNTPLLPQMQPFPNNPGYMFAQVELDTSISYYLEANEPVIGYYGSQYVQGSYTLPLADLVEIEPASPDTIMDTLIVCNGQPVILTADPLADVIDWSNGAHTPSIAVTADGLYTVKEAFLCPQFVQYRFYTVVYKNFNIAVDLPEDVTICPDSILTLTTGIASTAWSTGDTAAAISVTQPGTYYASLTDSCGRVYVDSIKVDVEYFELSLSASDTVADYGKTVVLNTAGSSPYSVYRWKPDGFFASQTAKSQYYQADSSRNFIVYGVSLRGCGDSASIRVKVNPVVQVPTAFSPNGDGLNDCFHPVSFGDPIKVFAFCIYDRWGKLVWQGNAADALRGWDGTYSGTPAEVGVYFFTMVIETSFGKAKTLKGDVTLVR